MSLLKQQSMLLMSPKCYIQGVVHGSRGRFASAHDSGAPQEQVGEQLDCFHGLCHSHRAQHLATSWPEVVGQAQRQKKVGGRPSA